MISMSNPRVGDSRKAPLIMQKKPAEYRFKVIQLEQTTPAHTTPPGLSFMTETRALQNPTAEVMSWAGAAGVKLFRILISPAIESAP
jgi:hypothetical protein